MTACPDLFNQLLRTVEAIGNKKTFDILKKAELGDITFDNCDVTFVTTKVAAAFGITVHEIIYGSGRKNERKYAIGFCAYYLHCHYNYSMQRDIQYFLKKILTLCHKYLKLISKMNSSHVHDRKYLEIKDQLDEILKVK